MLKPVILIPAYKPNHKLVGLIAELSEHASEFHQIILVNDGSDNSYQPIFEKALTYSCVSLYTHPTNLGKGQALKTGFQAVISHYSKSICAGVITCDADGQHLASDVLQLSKMLRRSPQTLWIGARDFDLAFIPLRSKFGNIFTRTLFKWFVGLNLKDTQSGLRGIPFTFLPSLLSTHTVGYDFELDMLLLAKKNRVLIKEHPIQTIYEEKNKSSHFNPIADSLKIYFVFFKYLIIALFSGLIDYTIFSVSYFLTHNLLISEATARILSGVFNFKLNKKAVFQSDNKNAPEASRYLLLWLANLGASYGLLNLLTNLEIDVYFSKIAVMLFLFIANFAIQKTWVFKPAHQ